MVYIQMAARCWAGLPLRSRLVDLGKPPANLPARPRLLCLLHSTCILPRAHRRRAFEITPPPSDTSAILRQDRQVRPEIRALGRSTIVPIQPAPGRSRPLEFAAPLPQPNKHPFLSPIYSRLPSIAVA